MSAKEMIEVRWHARAGQGAVTASKYLAESAMEEGYHIQAFPEYGAERRGAPVKSFTRLSKRPIRLHSQVYEPDVVLILDPSLVTLDEVTEGLPEDGIIIVNTPLLPEEVKKRANWGDKYKVYTVDATQIAQDTIGRPLPNMPMLAAFIRVTGLLSLESVIEKTKSELSKRFSSEIVEGNVNALKRGFEEVRG